MDEDTKYIVKAICTIIILFSVMYTVSTSPETTMGEVTAVKETTFVFNKVIVYFKTLNGADNALSVVYYGTLKDIEIGSQYRISVGWFNQLQSIEKLK